MKKAVIFDAMGVIFKTSDDVKDLLYPYLFKINPALSYPDVKKHYLKLSLGAISSGEFFGLLGFSGRYPQIEKDYLDSCLTLDGDFTDAAESLADKYDLSMLSNDASEWSAFLRKKFGLDKYFTDVMISGDVGLRKPAPEIYTLALKRLGRKATDCVFIDDNTKNLEAAESTGLHTLWFRRNNEPPPANGYSINNFSQLESILEKIFP